MVQHKLEGAMVYFLVDYCITIHTLQPQNRPIFVGIIIYGITCFNNERLYLIHSKYIGFPVIKMASLAILEKNLGVDGRRPKYRE